MGEKTLSAVIQEAYIQGVSTRSVEELVRAMGMTGISKSQFGRLREENDDRVNAFLDRPIEGDWPYLWLDATYVEDRQASWVVAVAVIAAVGVNRDARPEVLGMDIGAWEVEPFWAAFLRKLRQRGLRGRACPIGRSAVVVRWRHLATVLGSGRSGRPSGGSPLATLGGRLELAASCGLSREDLLP